MGSYKIWPLVSGLFHLALGFQDLLMLRHALVLRFFFFPKLYSFVWIYYILFIHSSVHDQMASWVVSTFCLL